jgi:hypothetical protein
VNPSVETAQKRDSCEGSTTARLSKKLFRTGEADISPAGKVLTEGVKGG